MFGAAIIVFRETLEAALIIGIIAAATQQVPNRNRWLIAGLLAGLCGAGMVAATTGVIAEMASGLGQELLNAAILGIAVLMLAWHNIWMTAHGRELASRARAAGRDVSDGRSECSVLFAVIALAVLREGSETALFLYGIASGGGQDGHTTLVGGLLGLIAGMVAGWALYAGLLRIPLRWFFSATSLLVLLLAAGMASQLARYLIQADLIPSLTAPLWDSSALLPPDSALGTLLHGLTGYDARPSGMQLIFYAAAFCAITLGMLLTKHRTSKTRIES
ncbi:ferrous iron permease EfeU [mine drainage metagenome]|uniref:Ferrous iron permease EfeU n=1 Tax=mine drainage metagenome TaxID=410659 RepID=A0A1J5QVF9_9ZZZZ